MVNNTTRPMNLDVGTAFERASVQFKGLNPREPGQWPLLPKLAIWQSFLTGRLTAGLGLSRPQPHRDGLPPWTRLEHLATTTPV